MQNIDSKLIELQISHLMQNIQYRLELMLKRDGAPSRIDLDGLKDKVRELYDQLIFLEFSCDQDQKIPESSTIANPVKIEPATETAKVVKPDKMIEPEKEVKPEKEVVPEKVIVPEKTVEPEPLPPTTRKVDVLGDKKTILADRFLNEDDQTIAAKIKKNPISDLKLAIGLNDKFLFIKELFQGKMEDYNAAIRKLNSFQMLDEALDYLKGLANTYQWAEDSEYHIRLRTLVERKYQA